MSTVSWRRGWSTALFAFTLVFGSRAVAWTVETNQLRLELSTAGDLVEAEACLPACSDPEAHHRRLDGAPVLLRLGDGADPGALQRSENAEAVTLTFGEPGTPGFRRWTVPRDGWRVKLEGFDAGGVTLAGGMAFHPPEAAGFGVWLEQTRYLALADGVVAATGLDEAPELEGGVAGGWTGMRSRFWAALLRPSQATPVTFAAGEGVTDPEIRFTAAPGARSWSLYLGPVEPAALASADPELRRIQWAGLWFWLRWICAGLFWLLIQIQSLIPAWGLAIIALSVAVHVLMRPLSAIADRLQDQVHRTEARLGPALHEIRTRYRGEEQSKRILDLYREHDVHPLYSLKSLAGVAVVIPVFIGAFDMLAENIWLDGRSFLWIQDLSRPDELAQLPFDVPFFGDRLNLLPFVMTGLSVAASALHRHEEMDDVQFARQRRNLVLMALAFLALFYTFPAGMVLYWTTNNALSVLKYGWQRIRAPERQVEGDHET